MLRGKEPVPGERGPWGGHGGDGALAGCGGRAVTVPGSCLIIPFSIWPLRVLGGDSECFLFLEGCGGSLGGRGEWHGGWLSLPEPSPVQCPPLCSGHHFSRQYPARKTLPTGSPQVPSQYSPATQCSHSLPLLQSYPYPCGIQEGRGLSLHSAPLRHTEHPTHMATLRNLRISVSGQKGTGVWIKDSVSASSLGSAFS